MLVVVLVVVVVVVVVVFVVVVEGRKYNVLTPCLSSIVVRSYLNMRRISQKDIIMVVENNSVHYVLGHIKPGSTL